jgi:hypothetical protein
VLYYSIAGSNAALLDAVVLQALPHCIVSAWTFGYGFDACQRLFMRATDHGAFLATTRLTIAQCDGMDVGIDWIGLDCIGMPCSAQSARASQVIALRAPS